MKKYAIIGLIFTALVFASCKLEKGGTIEVINDHSTYNASIAVYQGLVQVTTAETVTPGGKVTFSIEEDGTYTVNANFYQTLPEFTGNGRKDVILSGGNKVTVHIEPN